MRSPWLAYVPLHTAEDVVAQPTANPVGRERRFECVALFADVSGFTAMSEALGRRSGRQGAEELTGILNSYFEPMIALIESYGGIVGKFGGDALTVLFPCTPRTRPATARRALQCALEMQANMGRYENISTSAGAYSLAMKAGLALGPVLCTTLGERELRLEYIIAGRVLDGCADAEHHATKGEVVAENAVLEAAGEVKIAERRGEFTQVAGLPRKARRAPLQPPAALPAEAISTLARFIHPTIAQRIASGLTGFINEHRKVTVLFVRFDGFDYDGDPHVAAKLQAYLSAVIQIVHRYDGYLNKVDMGDKGSKYIILFGTPVAHENDEERAVRCALELIALPGPQARIGVNVGQAYCGEVGSEARKEYTVIGDAVNLAARLMQAAQPGQVLVSEAVRRGAEKMFEWESLPPITVKGKSEPIAIHTARGLRARASTSLQEQTYALPMVGREHELNQIRAALDQAQRGRGQIAGLVGEAGLGKSRLTAEVVQAATARGFSGFGGACQSYGTGVPYLVWRDVWRDFFGVDETASVEMQTQQLSEQLSVLNPRLAERLPLLGVVLNLPLADNALTRPLDAQLRSELLHALLLECLQRRIRRDRTPLLLVLEDCHWIDPLSQELLEFLGRSVADLALLLLVVSRPLEDGGSPLAWAGEAEHVREIRLGELPAEAATELMRLKVQGWSDEKVSLPEKVVTLIQERAAGNPFYVEELLNYLHDRGVDVRDAQAVAALQLPDSLHSLILSRIDQLSEAAKTSLKVASVIGRTFLASWLWGSYPALGQPEVVRRYLEDLSRFDLTPLSAPEPELEYIFKHITTQEVAYESLAFATRTNLHEAVGDYVERTYPEQRAQRVEVLAFHFGRSANTEKQRLYFRLAGEAAKAAYANAAAEDYFTRLLPLLPPEEQSAVRLELGEIWQLTGQWPKAEAAYRETLEQAAALNQPALVARAQMALGSLLARTQSFTEALEWYGHAQTGFEQLGDERGVGRVMEQLSFAHFNLGNFERARECAERQLAIATAHNDAVGISGALDYKGIALLQLGNFAEARANLQRAVETATAASYRRGAAIAYNDLAGSYWMEENYPGALAELQKAIHIASEIGYLNMLGTMLGNAGSIYRQYGEVERALTCFGQALQIAVTLGDQPSVALHLNNLGYVYFRRKEFGVSAALVRRAAELAGQLQMTDLLVDALYFQAYVTAQMGDVEQAWALNEQAIHNAAGEDADPNKLFLSTILKLSLQAKRGEPEAAQAALAQMLAEFTAPDQQAQIHLELWKLNPTVEEHRAAAALYRELYEQSFDAGHSDSYTELTGETLAPPPPLPPLPESVLQTPVDLKDLLRRVGVESGLGADERT